MKTTARVVNKKYEEFDILIGRPSKWGNPYSIGPDGGREMVIRKYKEWILTQPSLMNSLEELRGKRLGCFCKPLPCHGDVLIKLLEEKTMAEAKNRLSLGSQKVSQCQRCGLCETRIHTVFGEGNPQAEIMFIGEGPGQMEDEAGRPFVGKAGQLLTIWIKKELGLIRDDVYIANMVKCRPPNNREPSPEEMEACRPFLDKQIEIISPKIIITLGRIAVTGLLSDKSFKITRDHGCWKKYKGIDVLPTYHPAFLLRQMSEANKNAVKEDLSKVVSRMKGQSHGSNTN